MKFALFLLYVALPALAANENFKVRCEDRAAIERVYHEHRVGEKPPFEQVLPRATLEKLVQQDLRKEAVLKKAYGVEVTPAMLDAEVQRINSTTRAPAVLAEIKAALGNDPARFAEAMARPIVVERLLREKFENDDALHAPQRGEMERVRSSLTNAAAVPRRDHDTNGAATLLALLKQTHSNEVSEIVWRLGARAVETNVAGADDVEIKKRFGPDAQLLSSSAATERKLYFTDLPQDLQRVLGAQLRQSGDVSAVIETSRGFLLYLAMNRNAEFLKVAVLSLPKRNYDDWLSQQTSH
jgi:hypothetical protein